VQQFFSGESPPKISAARGEDQGNHFSALATINPEIPIHGDHWELWIEFAHADQAKVFRFVKATKNPVSAMPVTLRIPFCD
jgi:hypothetical protein